MSAQFMSAIVAGVLAGTALTAVPRSAVAAPDSGTVAAPDTCLSGPQGAAPKGERWYYRLDRTKRKCWYLRAPGDSAAQSAASQPAASQPAAPTAPAATPTAARAPARQPGPGAVQDARAEWPSPTAGNAPDTTGSIPQPAAWPPANAAAGAQRTPVTAQQNAPTQQAAMDARASEPSAVPQPTAPSAPPEAPAVTSQPLQATQADATPANTTTADTAAPKPTVPFHTLLLVIAGALALAGIIASIVLRLAARQRSRRELRMYQRANWEPTIASAPPPWRATPAPSRIEAPSPIQASSPIQAPAPIEAPSLIEAEPPRDQTTRDRDARDLDTDADADADIGQITDLLERFIQQGARLERATPAADTEPPELQRLARSSARA